MTFGAPDQQNVDSGTGSQVQADRAQAAVDMMQTATEAQASAQAAQLAYQQQLDKQNQDFKKKVAIGVGALAFLYILRKK